MTDQDDKSLGEIGRAVERIERNLEELRAEVTNRAHKLANDLAVQVGPVTSLGIRMNIAEKNIEEIGRKSESNRQTWYGALAGASVAGAMALIQWLAKR